MEPVVTTTEASVAATTGATAVAPVVQPLDVQPQTTTTAVATTELYTSGQTTAVTTADLYPGDHTPTSAVIDLYPSTAQTDSTTAISRVQNTLVPTVAAATVDADRTFKRLVAYLKQSLLPVVVYEYII